MFSYPVLETDAKDTLSPLLLETNKSKTMTCETSQLAPTTQNSEEMSLHKVSGLNTSEASK